MCVCVCFLEKGNNHCHPPRTVPSASSSNADCKGRKWNITTCYRQNRARLVVLERQRYFIFVIESAIIFSCEDAHSSIVTLADNQRRLRSSSHNSERSPNLFGHISKYKLLELTQWISFPFQIITPCFYKRHFNYHSQSALRSVKWSFLNLKQVYIYIYVLDVYRSVIFDLKVSKLRYA